MIGNNENGNLLSEVVMKSKVKDDSNVNKNVTSTLLMPLKNCLEQFEYLENKHQIISKLPR